MNENKNYYKVFGVVVESQIIMPELISISKKDFDNSDNKNKVYVKLSNMPDNVKNSIESGEIHYFSKEECWFIIKEIGIFRMINGNEIYVENIGGNDIEIKAFVLGSAFGCILIQRNVLAIHGGLIMLDDSGIIVTGHMGAGKSTLISGLIKKGYKFLADDVSAMEIDHNKVMGNPAYPQQKLCRDAAVNMGFDPENMIKVDDERDKFALKENGNFISSPKQIRYMFELFIKEDIEDRSVSIVEVKGTDKLARIIQNIYRTGIARTVGFKGEYLKNILTFASNIKYYKILRPQNMFSVEEQITKIIEKVV